MSRTYRRSYNKNNEPKVYHYIIGDDPWVNCRTGRDITFKVKTDNVSFRWFCKKSLKNHANRLRRQAERQFINSRNPDNIIESRFSNPYIWD